MGNLRAIVFGPLMAVFVAPVFATPTIKLLSNSQLCDSERTFCLRGSLSFDQNPRLLRLNGRVQKAPGPGMLRITLTGTNRLGHRRYAPMELRLRGNHSEIINHKMIPDYPDVYSWAIDRVEFVVDAGVD